VPPHYWALIPTEVPAGGHGLRACELGAGRRALVTLGTSVEPSIVLAGADEEDCFRHHRSGPVFTTYYNPSGYDRVYCRTRPALP
jgi:hypothetical protein